MNRGGLALAGFALALLRPASAAPDPHATPRPVPEQPAVVLAKYVHALDTAVAPKFVRFEYAVEQVGAHDLAQTHRVYRSGVTERDEILSVDGQPLPHPSVRIIRNRLDRYSIAAVAPRPANYTFTFLGNRRVANHYEYLFTTRPRAGGAFFTRGIAIVGVGYLPSQVVFSATTATIRAEGRLLYAPFDKHWMIVEAAVTARVSGKVARERIAWSHYVFPQSLPDSTFVQPRALATPTP